MSQHFTMEFEGEGPAKNVPGDLRSGDVYFANSITSCRREVDAAARRLGVRSFFDFAVEWESLQRAAEVAVYGKPVTELDEGDPEETDAMQERVDRVYYRTGPWFTPEEGLRTADPLIEHFEAGSGGPGGDAGAAGVLHDLHHFKAALQVAAGRGRRFRLRLSY